ncbi:MAG: PrsW family intramembrane metalloprotease [Chloroflexi bacterium]|nr:PrsW family intramembrane metalloprotease [Chloroflexota bacterium]
MSLASTSALVVAILIPIGYLLWVSQRDFFETRKVYLVHICFVWGMIAYAIVSIIQSNFIAYELLTRDQVVRFAAPILEELFKGAILLYLIRRADFTYFVDGAIYGFTVGIGFAIIENIEYVIANPSSALVLAVLRAHSTNLIHATASGSIGIALGLARFERADSIRRQLTLLASVLAAVALHMAFNNLVNSGVPILIPILIGCSGGVVIYVIMRRGLRIMKAWVDEELQNEESITLHEINVVNQLETVDKALAGFKNCFGENSAALAKEILLAQAQMGIYKRSAEKQQDEELRQSAGRQAAELRASMDVNRKKLGAYRMAYLRSIFPEDVSPLWTRLDAVMQALTTPKSEAGKGLWITLDQRVKESMPKGEGQ